LRGSVVNSNFPQHKGIKRVKVLTAVQAGERQKRDPCETEKDTFMWAKKKEKATLRGVEPLLFVSLGQTLSCLCVVRSVLSILYKVIDIHIVIQQQTVFSY